MVSSGPLITTIKLKWTRTGTRKSSNNVHLPSRFAYIIKQKISIPTSPPDLHGLLFGLPRSVVCPAMKLTFGYLCNNKYIGNKMVGICIWIPRLLLLLPPPQNNDTKFSHHTRIKVFSTLLFTFHGHSPVKRSQEQTKSQRKHAFNYLYCGLFNTQNYVPLQCGAPSLLASLPLRTDYGQLLPPLWRFYENQMPSNGIQYKQRDPFRA